MLGKFYFLLFFFFQKSERVQNIHGHHLILREMKSLFLDFITNIFTFFMLFHNLLITCVHIVLITLVIENEVKTETNNVLVVYRHFTRFIVRTNKARDFLQNCLERQRGLYSKVFLCFT